MYKELKPVEEVSAKEKISSNRFVKMQLTFALLLIFWIQEQWRRTFAVKTSLCVLADVTTEAIGKVTFIYIYVI